jgi:transcription initiation factor TFIID subunit 8
MVVPAKSLVAKLWDTDMTTFVEHLKRFAESARREQPTAADFGYMLRKHNVPISSLKPHLKNPVAKGKLQPKYFDPSLVASRTDYFRTTSTEFLGPELDGNADRQDKPWIPEWLPAFPSKHTYKFTPTEAMVEQDPAKKRAEALADSHKGEKALRRINRATKISQQKELKEMAQRNTMSRQRHENWEAMVKAMMSQHGVATGSRQELADHSVIVDSSARYKRREVPRASNRVPLDAISSKV